ncbi:MAG: nucleoside hydrolase, partial [Saprospiraceae bacterium]|nr:nucleoside hydrolase [Saprospiraceae bacterium]
MTLSNASLTFAALSILYGACGNNTVPNNAVENNQTSEIMENQKHVVIFDTDANNELDDQHALIYLLLNGDDFIVPGVTVNATRNGGDIQGHYDEAHRILKLAKLDGTVPLYKGANGNFEEIKNDLGEATFDGHGAVDFIIEEALKPRKEKLILLPVGKLTNIALALAKEPKIADHVRIVWLGSNYPEPGEYNQVNDVPSMNYVLDVEVPFEMVTVRYGKPSGSGAVMINQDFVKETMPGLGPHIEEPIIGRHDGEYHTFGDYSVSLFEHIDYHDEDKHRSLFDLVAVAVIKDPQWGQMRLHPAPTYVNEQWHERPENDRQITIWENFNGEAIVADLLQSLQEPDYVQV